MLWMVINRGISTLFIEERMTICTKCCASLLLALLIFMLHVIHKSKIIHKVVAFHLNPCNCVEISISRCGSTIWSRGPQLLRLKVANVAKQSHPSKASYLWPGSRAHLRVLDVFKFLMLKYAFSHILETLFL